MLSDFAREAVPKEFRRSWFSMFAIFIAVGVDLSSVILGAELSSGMSINQAILSVCIGSFLLAVLCSFCAVVGSSTNLSTSMITKYVFGEYGAKAFSIVIGVSCLGWFGVQVGFFAENAHSVLSNALQLSIDVKILSLFGGVLMMSTAVIGYRAIEKLSAWSAPLLLGLMLIILFLALNTGSPSVSLPISGAFSFGGAISLVIGIFILGAIISPDITRYAKSNKDAVIAAFFGIFIGNSFMIIVSILMSKAMGTGEMMVIFITLGWAIPGVLIFTLAQWTTNTANLYSSSLGFSLIFTKIPKWLLTIILGLIATSLAVFGIYDMFVPFLTILSIVVAPIGGIYTAEFFIVKREFARYNNQLQAKSIVNRSILAWALGMLVTYLTTEAPSGLALFSITTVAPLDGFLVGFLVQTIAGKVFAHRDIV